MNKSRNNTDIMTSYSASSSLSSSFSSPFVRKFTDSVVIGSQQATAADAPMVSQQPSMSSAMIPQEVLSMSQQAHAQAQIQAQAKALSPLSSPATPTKRVVACDFTVKIPTTALRIDMTILVSTNDRSSQHDVRGGATSATSPPRPSVSYKLTICTPKRKRRCCNRSCCPSNIAAAAVARKTPTTSTMTTLKWSSKFAVADGVDERNIDPFYEWTGSFDLTNGTKNTTAASTAISIENCSFYQVQGQFLANYDNDAEDDSNNHNANATTTAASSVAAATPDTHQSNTNSFATTTTTATLGAPPASAVILRPSRKMKKKLLDDDNDDDLHLPIKKRQRRSSNYYNHEKKTDTNMMMMMSNNHSRPSFITSS